MHDTALTIGSLFLDTYARPPCTVVELGAMNVNGTLRNMAPKAAVYVGLDVEAGHGVDVVVKPGAPLPLASEAADLVVSSSMFEHDSFFWETFLEMVRIVKPNGAIYINAPSNGQYHRYPADNWRFYPDCGKALESWARKNSFTVTLVESFIAERKNDIWNDFVAIFLRSDASLIRDLTFLSHQVPCTNAWQFGKSELVFPRAASQDMVLIEQLRQATT
jgi:SAM-dependent methyltransferase